MKTTLFLILCLLSVLMPVWIVLHIDKAGFIHFGFIVVVVVLAYMFKPKNNSYV